MIDRVIGRGTAATLTLVHSPRHHLVRSSGGSSFGRKAAVVATTGPTFESRSNSSQSFSPCSTSGRDSSLSVSPSLIAAAPSNVRPGSKNSDSVSSSTSTASTSSAAFFSSHQTSNSSSSFLSSSSTSSSPPPPSTPAISHPHPAFEQLVASLSESQPCFGARADEIQVIASPQAFYDDVIEMIKRAKRRILISSLYIGLEQEELIDTLRTALSTRHSLRLTIVLDYNRSTRPSPSKSTVDLLLPLIEQFGDRCEVYFFRSPKLRGIMERIVPPRFNEGWGTWHAKWYAADDEVVISGANLAASYFSNRQDRYMHFRSHPTLLSYISSLSRLIEGYSYRLFPSSSSAPSARSRSYLVFLPRGGSLAWPSSSIHPRAFQAHANATLSAFQKAWRSSNSSRARRIDVDTWFWPVLQSGPMGLKEEEKALGLVLNAAGEAGVKIDLTSGYFGLYKSYKKAVLNAEKCKVDVITAAPRANGFYGSKGISALIPEAYTLLEKRFYRDAAKKGRLGSSGITLKEWDRQGWTYHAKGIWLSPSPDHNPFLTFIGSSNLSTRSLKLDTELSMILTTSSPSLRRALGNEVKGLDDYTVKVEDTTWVAEERKISLLTKVLVGLGIGGML